MKFDNYELYGKRLFWVGVVFALFFAFVFIFWNYEKVHPSIGINAASWGQFGDIIGGIVGTIVALIGAFLLFETLKQQRKHFNRQQFETRFFELLKLHKENVNEISIDGYDGRKIEKRKAFVSMYKEFRYAFFVTKIAHERLIDSKELTTKCSDEELLKLAYIFFYAGVGIHSDKLTKAMAGNRFTNKLYDEVNAELLKVNENHKKYSKGDKVSEFEFEKLDTSKTAYSLSELELKFEGLGKSNTAYSYRPFVGHLNRFGHYYRHLFQTVKYVVNQEEKLVSEKQKLEYLRTLRSQLSDHEQAMIYYNAICDFGEAWLENKYFTKYKMIHNLPLPLADFGITPEEKFKEDLLKDSNMFEWQKFINKKDEAETSSS